MEANDYYPFGQVMPSRTYALTGAKKTRFGFNGKEKDAEVGSDDYDFGARMYDARIARWMSLDPSQNKYPHLSPYNAFEDNPIYFIDPDGKDARYSIVGNTIIISTVVHIYGPGANEKLASDIQKDVLNTFKGGKFIGEDGKEYNVKFDISVKYEKVNSIEELTIKPGDNVAYIFDDPEDPEKQHRSHVEGNGKYGLWSNKSEKLFHEIGHFLGLADKYYDVPFFNKKTKKWEIYGKDYPKVDTKDFMGMGLNGQEPKMVKSELAAIGNEVLRLFKNSGKKRGYLDAKGAPLDKSPYLPETIDKDVPDSIKNRLHGYSNEPAQKK